MMQIHQLSWVLLTLLFFTGCRRPYAPATVAKNRIDVIAFREICQQAIGSEVPEERLFLHSGTGGEQFYVGLVSTQNGAKSANIEIIAKKLATDSFPLIASVSSSNNTVFYQKYSACVSTESSSDARVFFSVLLDSEDRVVVTYTIY